MSTSTISTLRNENIISLRFPDEDVFDSRKGQIERDSAIKRLQRFAELGMKKATILFIDDKGIKKIESSIQKFTEHYIFLNAHTVIPLNRILHIA